MTFLAGAIMSSKIISVFEGRDIRTAETLMKTNNIRHLPVINEDNELSGIISVKDVVKAQDKRAEIRSVMTSPVKVVKKNTNVKAVIELMLKHKFSAVLVASEEDIVGIVTTDDLLKLLAQVLDDNDNLTRMDVGSFFDETWKSYT